MLLQSTIPQSPLHLKLRSHSPLSSFLSLPSGFFKPTFVPPITICKHPVITCSISKVRSYGTVDYERKTGVKTPSKWKGIYKRVSLMENPEKGAASVLNQLENDGNKLTKWDLCRVVKELRKYRRFKLALEVYQWMNNRAERFRISTSDSAIQLDLISKVHGIPSAEDYFVSLPDSLKDKRIYGALLNAYVRAKMKEKAESLISQMKDRGYATHALSFNVMMTLYVNIKDYEKVDLMVSEMMERQIPLDLYSYNIWLSACGAQGSVEKMEQVYEQMKLDSSLNPTWTTFSTMATMFIKMGQVEKAEECLRKIEGKITGRDRMPYHYLISLYGSAGKKEEVQRVWEIYKSIFPSIPNLCYRTMVSSLIRLDDIEAAEKIYANWLELKSNFDPRIGNLIMGWYARKGFFQKAKDFFDDMGDVGGKRNSTTWEILGEIHIKEKRISEALTCLQEAALIEGSEFWKPKTANISTILELCEQENDEASKEVLFGLLRKLGCLENESYMKSISTSNGDDLGNELLEEKGRSDDEDDAEMLFTQMQESL